MSQNPDEANPNGARPACRTSATNPRAAPATHEKPAPSEREIAQAGEDVERGLVDTERRGVRTIFPIAINLRRITMQNTGMQGSTPARGPGRRRARGDASWAS